MSQGRARLALVLAAALLAGGCARLFDHYDVGPGGLARADARLRHLITDTAATHTLASLLDEQASRVTLNLERHLPRPRG